MKSMKKMLAGVLALTMLAGTMAFAADSPSKAVEPKAQDKVAVEKVGTVSTTDKGTATINAIAKTSKKTVTVPTTVTVDGVDYAVTEIAKNAFKDCKKAKTVKLNITKSITVKKGAFAKLNTKKMTIKVSKKMSSKELKKFKSNLKKAGFKGSVKKSL